MASSEDDFGGLPQRNSGELAERLSDLKSDAGLGGKHRSLETHTGCDSRVEVDHRGKCGQKEDQIWKGSG